MQHLTKEQIKELNSYINKNLQEKKLKIIKIGVGTSTIKELTKNFKK